MARVGYSRLAECGEVVTLKLSRLDRSRQSAHRSKNLEAQRPPGQCRRAEVRRFRWWKHALCHKNSGLCEVGESKLVQDHVVSVFEIGAYRIVTPKKAL